MSKELEKDHMRKLKITLPFPKYLLCFIIIVAGITWYRLQYGRPKTYYHEQVTEITGIVYQIADDDDQMVLYVRGLERVRVTLYKKIEIKLGDCVTFTGKMKLPTGTPVFHLFQYDLYLRSKHIQWLFYADQGTIVSRNQNIFYEIKQGVIDHLKRYESEAYLKAFLLGDTSMFTDSDKQEFRALGISHLFAVSGMHVTLFTSLLMWLLRKWCSPPIMKTIVAVILGYYLFLTGFTPSVIRAVVMTIVLLWNQRISALSLLLFLGSVLLLYQPYYVYHPGFVFSFTVSFYLLLFRDWINASHCYFAQLIKTSVIAFLASLPLTLYFFCEINLCSVINNLIYVPYVSYLLFPMALLSSICPCLDSVLQVMISIFEFLLRITTAFKWFLIFPHIPITYYFLYSVMIILAVRKMIKRDYNFFLFLIIMLTLHYMLPYTRYSAKLTMLDVGQGDCLLITLKHNQGAILIDTGGIVSYGQQEKLFLAQTRIIPYLKSQGIRKLTALILTHGDYDHAGEAIALMKSFPVDQVILNAGDNNHLEQKLISFLETKRIFYQQVSRQNIRLAGQLFQFLNLKNQTNENRDSLICYTKIENRNIIFMGDATKEEEKYVIDTYNLPKMDIIKVGHHGSSTSSSQQLVSQLQPEVALISVGDHNRYGHPSQDILKRYQKLQTKIYRTDQVGSVQITLRSLKIRTYHKYASA